MAPRRKTKKGKAKRAGKSQGATTSDNDQDDPNVIFHDAFDKIWKKRELPKEDHLPPRPSEKAMEQTLVERHEFEQSQKGTPAALRHRFFLVNYGIEMLEHYQTQRSLHIDLVVYTFFVINFCLYTFNNVTVNDAVHIKDAFRQSIVDFPYLVGSESFDERSGASPPKTMLTVNNREEILPWLDHVLIGSPYGPFGDGGVEGNISSFGMIGDQNVVIGKIRIQQSRTRPDSCEMHPILGSVLSSNACYAKHTPSVKDTAAFGPGTSKASWNLQSMPERSSDGKYLYRTASELTKIQRTNAVNGKSEFNPPIISPFFYGVYGRYDFSGYAVDLPKSNPDGAHQIVKQLIQDKWIDEGTAFVTVSITTYNPQINMFMFCQLHFEAPPGGFVSPGVTFRPFRMPGLTFKRPGESSGLVNYYLNRIIFSIWVLFWFIRLCLKLYNDYRSLDVWDVIDLTNLVLLSWQILNRFQWETTNTMVTTFDSYAGHDSYIDFCHLSWLFESERLLTGINGVLVFIKYFKLTRVVVRLSMIVHVMEIAARELFSWIIIAGMLFASLAFAAHISFGPTLIEFHTLVRSFMTLFNYLIGLYEQAPETVKDLTRKTGYDSLDYAGQHATVFVAQGGFFFAFFNLCYYFLLTRILVAMLISAYSRVLREIERDEEMEAELAKMRNATDDLMPKTWHDTWYGKFWFLYCKRGDEIKVLARLKSTPELLERGYLNYVELKEALSGTVKNPENLDAMCKRLMDLQRIHLHRVPEIIGVLKDRKWNKVKSLEEYVQQHAGENIQELNDMLLEKLRIEDSVFALENWDRDIMSGDVLHSAMYVFRNHLDAEYKKFSGILKKQQRSLRQIMEQLILIETRIGRAYHYYTGSKLEHTFYTSEEGKALFEDYHAKIRQENEEKKQAEIEMMEGVNEEDDLDEEDENVEGADAGDIEMVERKD